MRVRRTALVPLLGTTVALATVAFAAPAAAKTSVPTCFGKKATIVVTGRHANGTKKNDVIVVTNKKGATVNGGAGNDLICGGAGKDVLSGGAGNDKINGGKGNDKIDGGAGNDTLLGGAGNDVMTLGAGKDSADGGAGNDTITGGPGVQVLKGGAGNDRLVSYQGGTIARAHVPGVASVIAGCQQTLIGGPGADTGTSGACPVTFIGDSSDSIIEKLGDAPVKVTGPVTVVGSTTTTPVTNPALQGTVRGAANAALGGITVRIVQSDLVLYAVTDTSGHYAFPSSTADGTYTVVANPAGVAGHPQNTAYQPSAAQSAFLPHTGPLDITLTPAAAVTTGTMTGLVADAGGFLANVPVTVDQHDTNPGFSASVATDASGRYTVTNVPVGHTYSIVANDLFADTGTYLPRRSIEVRSNVALPPSGSSVATITLTHAATISGTVHDPANTPLAGAFVSAFDQQTQNVGYGSSDANGHFIIGSLTDTGSWGLGAYVDQYEPAAATPFATITTLDDQVTNTDVVLRHQAPQSGPYYVSGAAVSDDTGNGIAVPVTLRNAANDLLDTQTSNASDGSYFMADTYPAGTYTLTVNDPGAAGFDPTYAHDVQTVTLPANGGDTAQSPDYFGYSSLVPSGSLDALVQDDAATPNPLSGALVSATDEDGFVRTALSGADGHAVITGLQPGYLSKVTFTKSGYYADENDDVTVTSNATTHVTATAVAAANVITGTVTDNAGTPAPVAGVPVVICPSNVPSGTPAECLSPIASGADGHWTSPELPAGDYEVAVNYAQYDGFNPAYGADDQDPVTVSAGSSPTVDSHLAPAGSVTVTVLQGDGTTPAVDAYVTTQDDGVARYGFTDENGTVTLMGVEAGTDVTLVATDSDDSFTGTTTVNITAGDTATASITLDTLVD
ncbi:MAG TPA: carboxypeptidase regulatory-like domain-containing protein [Mycobacteriales bacterium]|nr:carboxypeptidase regulatory-like domain-containing protein [Mycobacteriales bacterium]